MQQDDRKGLSPGSSIDPAGEWVGRFVILGQTSAGRTFRPSDWAERLAGVMAVFRPAKAGTQQHLTYSPYVVPSSQRGIRCVIVDPQLRQVEPMAYSFVLNFARDNDLITERLTAPSAPSAPSAPDDPADERGRPA